MNLLVVFVVLCVACPGDGSPLMPIDNDDFYPPPLAPRAHFTPDENEMAVFPELSELSENPEVKWSTVQFAPPAGMHIMPSGQLMAGESHDAWQAAAATDGETADSHLVKRDADANSFPDQVDEKEAEPAEASSGDGGELTKPYNETFHYNLMQALSSTAENEVEVDENLDNSPDEGGDTEFNERETREPEPEPAREQERDRGEDRDEKEKDNELGVIDKSIQKHELLTDVLKSFAKLYEVVKDALSDKPSSGEYSSEGDDDDAKLVELEKRARANTTAAAGAETRDRDDDDDKDDE